MPELRKSLIGGAGALGAVALGAAPLLAPGTSIGKPSSQGKTTKPLHRVYAESNDTQNNQVVVFSRAADGTLKKIRSVATGGKGGDQAEPGCPAPCPILDTQGEVALANAKKLLFAVNAGSNSISTFQVTRGGLKLRSVTPSRGVFPNSIAIHGNLLYVLNTDSLNIAGFRIGSKGKLTAIKGSSRPLVGAIQGLPRQIGFDNTGRVLMVTLLANNSAPPPSVTIKDTLNTFKVSRKGVAGKATGYDSSSPLPFAFEFDRHNRAIMAEVHDLSPAANGQAGSFSVSSSGKVKAIDTEATKGSAPCWVQVSKDGRFAYIVNTGGPAPTGAVTSEFSISRAGKLKLLGTTKALPEFANTDDALSADGRYLYVNAPLASGSKSPGPNSHVDEYKVRKNGRLTYIGQTPGLGFPGLSGLAAS